MDGIRRQQDVVARHDRIGHWFWRIGESRLWCSGEAARIFRGGEQPGHLDMETILGDCGTAAAERFSDALRGLADSGTAFDVEIGFPSSDGAPRSLRILGVRDPGGPEVAAGIVQDLGDRQTVVAALDAAERRHADFVEVSSDWVWEMGPDLRFSYISPQAEARTGFPVADHIGRTRRELLNGQCIPPEMEEHLARLDRREPFRDFRYWRTGPDGRRRCHSISGKAIFDQDGTFLGYRGVGRDVTDEQGTREELLEANRQLTAANTKTEEALASLQRANALLAQRNAETMQAQEEIRRAALHDPLTGLANRRCLDLKLAESAAACRAAGRCLGILHVDLDRFKQINDTLGHAAGDAVLRHVAAVLTRIVRADDLVARVGGDEFVVVCTEVDGEAALESLARRLVDEFTRPFEHEGRDCWFGISVGIAAARGLAIRPEELLVNADIALHRAKSQGRGCYQFFSLAVQRQIVRYKALADSVLAGLKQGEFVPHYQPQICAETGRIVGLEALARWHHPEEGLLAPDEFLRIAEDLGVVATLDRTILECAVHDLEVWTKAGIEVPKLSVNVSARRLLDRDLICGLRKMNLPRDVLSFELLESVFLDDLNDTIAWNIDMLKEMGIEVELDDFGSGHASIISLVKLGPDALKIDRELISSITTDLTRCGLVRSIIEIGHSLGVRVIAEGVETRAQAILLQDLGCDALQGFYYAMPMSADAVPAFFAKRERQNAAAMHRAAV